MLLFPMDGHRGIMHKVDVKGASQEKFAGSTMGRITVAERKQFRLTFPFRTLMVRRFFRYRSSNRTASAHVFSTDRS